MPGAATEVNRCLSTALAAAAPCVVWAPFLSSLSPQQRWAPLPDTYGHPSSLAQVEGVRAVEVANGADDLDLHPEDPGRVEDVEGSFTTMQLRGLFDRPPTFLHHGRARSLREVICTPDHPALRRTRLPVMQGIEEVRPGRLERGFNETTGRQADGALNPADRVIDTHGGTSHLGPRQIDDLVAFMRSIQ